MSCPWSRLAFFFHPFFIIAITPRWPTSPCVLWTHVWNGKGGRRLNKCSAIGFKKRGRNCLLWRSKKRVQVKWTLCLVWHIYAGCCHLCGEHTQKTAFIPNSTMLRSCRKKTKHHNVLTLIFWYFSKQSWPWCVVITCSSICILERIWSYTGGAARFTPRSYPETWARYPRTWTQIGWKV